ncbi:MAG: CopG family transcriptional regulator [Terriglobia bacterium]
MPATRRTQLLMDPEEFRRLRTLARQRKTSVAQLIRTAVREAYLKTEPDRKTIVQMILDMQLPVMDWKKVRKEIEAGHAGLS